MIRKAVNQEEAAEVIAWAENNLTVTITAWQKELFMTLLMYPDVKFDVRIPRAGRG